MHNLFLANIVRLWKSRLIGIGVLIFSGTALLLCCDHYHYFIDTMVLDGVFFGYVYIAGIPVSVLAGLFLGVEYGDGAIRNKLIAGHKRRTIYLANFLAVFASSLLMSLSYVIMIAAVGIPMFGGLKSDWQIILLMILQSILTLCAVSAVFTMVGMLFQNKAVSAVLCLLLVFSLQGLTISIDSSLRIPEFFDNSYYMHGMTEEEEMEEYSLVGKRNPNYVGGTKRVVYEFINDFNPISQGLQIADMFEEHPKHMARLPLYSLILIFGVTGEGIYLFGKKDIK